jgi:hypothetical protein
MTGDRDAMTEKLHIDSGALMREIACYLAVVDAFRAEHCEPRWLPELAPQTRRPTASRVPRS